MTPANDALLDRAVAGDRVALTDLLEQHAPQLRRALEGRIPRRWQAVLSVDDVLQETYIDAFLDVGRFEPRDDGSFAAWLITLARRNLLDALRMLQAEKRGQRRRVEPSLPGGSLAVLYSQLGCSTSTPSRRASQLEAWTHLEQAISKLPDTYRTVVEMYDLAEQSAEEVAAAVHRSPGAVFMLRARAHRQLGDIMGAASMFFSGAR